jgi:N-(5-amino-5-carboxypentanoyl)-L-cysteinyl-D-valine synthase
LFNNYLLYIAEKYGEASISNITFEILAKNYIQYMKFIQSTGPYNLFGWSFGGVLAFEITRQLLENGESVNNLFLLDPYFNYKKAINKLSIKTLSNDINYKYLPKFTTETLNLKITLFKSAKITKIHSKMQQEKKIRDGLKISNYFTLNTIFNNLDDLVSDDLINLVLINSDHDSLIENKFLLNYMAQWESIQK